MRRRLVSLGLALLGAAAAGEEPPVRITAAPAELSLAAGATGTLRLELVLAEPYHIYSSAARLDKQGVGPAPTTIAVKAGSAVVLAGAPRTSAAQRHFDPAFGREIETLAGRAWIDVPLQASATLTPGSYPAALVVGYQACTGESCLPPAEVEVTFTLAVGLAASPAADAKWAQLERRIRAPQAIRGADWAPTAELAWAFHGASPEDPRRWQAWLVLLRTLPRFDHDPEAKRLWIGRTAALEQAAAAATDVPEALRELFASRQVSALVLPFTNGRLPSDWRERLLPPIEDLAARFPEGDAAFVYFFRLTSAVESQFASELPALVERMAGSPNRRTREFAAERRLVSQAMAQPLDLRFTALDGREVDTAKLRGKVVLVDFWATWCVPCIQAMPHLKELYAKYHGHGLEIINVSVDRENARPALEKLVAKLELPWPQFFDGKAHQTEFAVRYGVQPIPHVLLAGPDGMIVAVNPPKERLEAEIRRLLRL